MNTPAAKRRRVEATKTLRKPFRSPLISRRFGGTDESKTNSDKEYDGAGSSEAATTKGRGINTESSADASSSSASPLGTKVARMAARGWAPFKSPSITATTVATTAVPVASGSRREADRTPDGTMRPGPSSEVATEDRSANREAGEFGEAAGASADGDDELEQLIVKWKGASRVAAEMVFNIAKQRIDSAGGPKAWREQQKSWDDLAPETWGSDDGEGRRLDDDDRSGKDESSCGNNEHDSNEEYEAAFTMGTMLKTMNIDPVILGYDEHEDAWID